MKKKQGGFGLIETLLSMLILSGITLFFTQEYLNYIEKRNASEFKLHTERVIEALQKYQYHKVTVEHNSPYSPSIWPANLDALMTDYPNQFWPMCSKADAKNGMCQRPDSIPWSTTSSLGYKIDFVGTPPIPKATLIFPLSSSVVDSESRAPWANALQRLPFIKLESNQDLSIEIGDPLMVQVYKEFLQRNGSTELTSAWDVGNQSILNAKNVSIRTQDNRQQSLGIGTVKEFLAQHNTRVYKNSWSCATGLRQTIHVSVNAPMSPNSSTEYVGIAGFKPYATETSTYWTLGLDYNAKIKSTGKWQKMHSGFLNVRLNCSQ